MIIKKSHKIGLTIAAVIVLAFGGYAALWFSQARIAKNELTALIADINKDSEIISYESITTTGFPSTLALSINQPKIALSLHTLLKPLGEAMSAAPDGTEQAEMRKALLGVSEWTENVALDGRLLFRINAFSNRYAFEPVGDYLVESTINGKQERYSVVLGDEARGCQIAFNKKSGGGFTLWDWNYLFGDVQTAISSLSSLDCRVASLKIFINDSKDSSYSSTPTTIHYENSGTGDTLDVHFRLENAESIANAEFDRLVAHYYQGFYPNETLPLHYHLAPLGKQRILVDGGMAMHSTQPESQPVNIHLNELTYVSDISETHNTLHIQSDALASGGKINLDIKSDTSFKEAAYHNYLSQAGAGAAAIYKSMQQTQPVSMDEASFVNQYQSLVPKIHEWGTLSIALAGNGEVKQGMGMPLELSKFAINVKAYGVEANGKGEIASALMPVPTGAFEIRCRSCLLLVDDTVAWFGRMQPLLRVAEPENYLANIAISPDLTNGIKEFLKTLATTENETLSFKVSMDTAGAVTVNGKSMAEVDTLYQQQIGNWLKLVKSPDTFQSVPVQPVSDGSAPPSPTPTP